MILMRRNMSTAKGLNLFNEGGGGPNICHFEIVNRGARINSGETFGSLNIALEVEVNVIFC